MLDRPRAQFTQLDARESRLVRSEAENPLKTDRTKPVVGEDHRRGGVLPDLVAVR